ncbi:Alpha/beta hydrolase [Pediococcus damnosus]|uniref:Alpha/beta hydrolase n=1 Tax=Pediococcus damnosus TaxID=51663 RepID=A0AAC9FJM9_9LACO|nr:alpha/beta hydrolase [Pediococcus damnosus]AMV61071.1 Alpha/beta hydrolase [Pediococcus damnosus]AMV63635.1 Alpha/beta hydrolase [Pediococcus damnosus]AMV65431.1 Alpha/beta hydrolase [Pediococcus damnosus]AMV66424.1 Alpha/beta hydrolase [Pediococcus damnosus]KJU73273.1 hypothetical protein AH70_02715 [Pediococcus damnosus LMG 28219]
MLNFLNNSTISLNGRKSHHHSAKNAISFHDYLPINGIQQWVSIDGQQKTNPILFIIHGGPASTYSMFTKATQLFSTHFTVVHWDQRGAGKTYLKQPVVPKNLQTLVDDGLALTKQLKHAFPKAPIVLLGSSIGSIIANLMLQQGENLYAAYIATEQMTSRSHQVAFNHLLSESKDHLLKKSWLNKLPYDAGTWSAKQIAQFNVFSALQQTDVPNMVTDLFIKNLLHTYGLNVRDWSAFCRGLLASRQAIQPELDSFDYRRLLSKTDVPFFVFQGSHDPITPAAATRTYFNQVQAPDKQMIIVPNSGHLCFFANPQFFLDKLVNVVLPVLD